MGSLETRAKDSLNSPQHSSGSEQQISHRCHQADEVKRCENDMDWRPPHANTLIRLSLGDKLLQFSRSDSPNFWHT
jgi:hypothetical protein